MLRVSDNGRFLVHDNGKPFFYLGDTAWSLFQRLDREEADMYLENRADKGFTVIQAVALAEQNCLETPNAYGHLPLIDNDPLKPNEKYFEHVDYVISKANELGMYVGLLPTWGDKVGYGFWGDGPHNLINRDNAFVFGKWMAERYGSNDIIWILGGDRIPEGNEEIWEQMVRGIKDGEGERHNLMTYHPMGQQRSSTFFHNSDWLDFNMLQSGHQMFRDNYKDISSDYSRMPVKPCMDAEPAYENHPTHFSIHNGYLNDQQVRYGMYNALFAGAHGHTYGCHEIWQFASKKLPLKAWPVQSWQKGLDAPGAFQVGICRRLIESRPYLSRIPDQSLVIRGQNVASPQHVTVCRDGVKFQKDATYIMAYFPGEATVALNVGVVSDARLRIWWFDPRDGSIIERTEIDNPGELEISSVGWYFGDDRVLVIDGVSHNYPPPANIARHNVAVEISLTGNYDCI